MGLFRRLEKESHENLKTVDGLLRSASRPTELIIPIIRIQPVSQTFVPGSTNHTQTSRHETKTEAQSNRKTCCEDMGDDARHYNMKEGRRKRRRTEALQAFNFPQKPDGIHISPPKRSRVPPLYPMPKNRNRPVYVLAYTGRSGDLKGIKKLEDIGNSTDSDSDSFSFSSLSSRSESA